MTQSYLLDYVKNKIWCAPEQDKQIIYRAARISKPSGVVNYGYFMGRRIDMPNPTKTYHVFSIGQIDPGFLSLKKYNPEFISEHWVSFKDSINSNSTLINLYTGAGKEIPKFSSYYMYSHEKCLMVCIEEDSKFFIDYKIDDLYLRFYNNIEYDTDLPFGAESLYCTGRKITSSLDVLQLQAECVLYQAKTGHVFCYRNGFLVDSIDAYTCSVGDVAEFVYDPTVKRKVTFSFSNLSVFSSDLDDQYKYLLHYPSVLSQEQIDFEDDIDVYIVCPKLSNRFNGYYFHRNSDSTHRMVSHRDYSVSVTHFMHIATNLLNDLQESPSTLSDLKIQMVIRSAGDRRPLCLENQRLFELYKLDDLSVYRAMIGLDATVSVWKAEELENSGYCRLMSSQEEDISPQLIQSALGYNACSVLLGDTPKQTKLKNGLQSVDMPLNLAKRSTVYEYDENGHLLGFYDNLNSSDYECVNSNARLVEAISGKGSFSPGTVCGENNLPIPNSEFRVYKCNMVSGVPDNIWSDVTTSTDWENVSGVLNWTNQSVSPWLMIRRLDEFLTYSFLQSVDRGVLEFSLLETVQVGSMSVVVPVHVPYGDIDVFLNDKSTIKGLDYIVDYPVVRIYNKEYLQYPSETTLQSITVRLHGFCHTDLSMDVVEDYGFVEHGVLSNNNVYDIRDDKVLRICVGGKTMHRSSLVFSEFFIGIDPNSQLNGKPYQIKDIVVPIEELVDEDTYSFRNKSMAIDKAVSDYMTLKKPQPPRPAYSVIQQRHRLYSPFFSRLLSDMAEGIISDTSILAIRTDVEVLDFCKPYEWILKNDPVSSVPKLNDSYVLIQPHIRDSAISLNKYQYSLFLKVVRLYGKGMISVNPLVSLSP